MSGIIATTGDAAGDKAVMAMVHAVTLRTLGGARLTELVHSQQPMTGKSCWGSNLSLNHVDHRFQAHPRVPIRFWVGPLGRLGSFWEEFTLKKKTFGQVSVKSVNSPSQAHVCRKSQIIALKVRSYQSDSAPLQKIYWVTMGLNASVSFPGREVNILRGYSGYYFCAKNYSPNLSGFKQPFHFAHDFVV